MAKQEIVERKPILSLTRKDFKVEFMRGSGPGGQHRNTTDSAVRIFHLPSGALATSCDQRSQRSNIRSAFQQLTKRPRFQDWLKLEISRKMGIVDQVEDEVNRMMADQFIKTEVIGTDGKWIEVDPSSLKDTDESTASK